MPSSIGAAGEVGRRERGRGGQQQRDQHEHHPPAVGAQQRHADAAACACGAPRRGRRRSQRARSQPRHLALRVLAGEEHLVGQPLLGDLAVERRSPPAARACVPRAAISPSSRTTTSSASAMVDSRWAITKVVRPSITSRERRLDAALGGGVDARRRVVEDQDARLGAAARGRSPRAGAGRRRASARARRRGCRARRAGRRAARRARPARRGHDLLVARRPGRA